MMLASRLAMTSSSLAGRNGVVALAMVSLLAWHFATNLPDVSD